MKRYPITPYYLRLYYSCTVLSFFFVIALIIFEYKFGLDISGIIGLLISVSGLIAAVYSVRTDFQCGSIAVDFEGISMKIGSKTIRHAWTEFTEAGIVVVHAGSNKSFWVYFSKNRLTYEEKHVFLSKTRRNLDSLAFFQYRKEVLQEVMPYVPDQLAQELLKAENYISSVK